MTSRSGRVSGNPPERLQIGDRPIGPGHPAYVIAEVAQAHDGSLGMAHAFVDAAAQAGADAVKFQTHIAEAESTLDEPFRVGFSKQDATRYDYWKRMEFTAEQWSGLAQHARSCGLAFLSTPFSGAAFDLLAKIGMPAWKVGSGEFRSVDLIRLMIATRAPILYSTGMAGWAEIDEAAHLLRSEDAPFALLQCTSIYPTPLEGVGLNVIDDLRKAHGCPVGLSDHSGSVLPGLAALSRGADILEVHVTFDRGMFGPDVSASITFEELSTICAMRDALAVMDANPVDKDAMAERLSAMRTTFGRSLAPARALARGTTLQSDMLIPKKPAGGIPADALGKIVGRRLSRDADPMRILHWDDLAKE